MVFVEKFEWFGESQIFSVDIHPSDKIFAICQDKTISIWKFPNNENLNFTKKQLNNLYFSEMTKQDPSEFLITKIKQHNATVNVCRFSPNGEYLAAGSDDKTVSLFKCENWSCFKIFRDHEQVLKFFFNF
jgi:WD40 repeat protein